MVMKMETVEVVIRIPKKVLKDIQCVANGLWGRKNLDDLELAILDGTVLPKGHDRLISTGDLDVSKLVDSDMEWVMGICDISRVQSMIDNAPTVIEADRGDDNG